MAYEYENLILRRVVRIEEGVRVWMLRGAVLGLMSIFESIVFLVAYRPHAASPHITGYAPPTSIIII